MSRRTLNLSLSLAALCAGVGLAIAVSAVEPVGAAAPATASINAVDYAWQNPDSEQNSATIAPGGTVTFAYPTGSSAHNVSFSGLQPASCTQTAGTNSGAAPPLPAAPDGPGWSGTCQFDTPGAYAFVCGLHSFMTGTVQVGDPPTTTGPGTGTTPAPPGGTTPGDTTPGGSPAPSAPPRVSVARSQRGAVLRGAVTTPAGPSRIVVTAFASSRSLAGQAARRVRVGLVSKRSAGTGRTRFAVRLKAAARGALRRRGRLAVSLRIVVTAPAGQAITKRIAVTVRSG